MSEEQLDQMMDRMVDKLARGGLHQHRVRSSNGAEWATAERKVDVKITDKSVDFLGFEDAEGSAGLAWALQLRRARYARSLHRRRDQRRGEDSTSSGDTLNLDVASNALLRDAARRALKLPLNLEYEDLHVHQCEYQSSCATVIMLDCSHSMILYGEDRFTPGQESRAGARAPDPHALSGGFAALRAVPRLGGRSCACKSWRACKWGRTTPTPAKVCILAQTAARPRTQGHEADHHDHRRQAERAHP